MCIFRETVWKLYYILNTDSGEFIDAETIPVLDRLRLTQALSAVDQSGGQTYADIMYTGDASELFNYEAMFSLIFTMPVRQSDFAAFKSALITIWEQSRTGWYL